MYASRQDIPVARLGWDCVGGGAWVRCVLLTEEGESPREMAGLLTFAAVANFDAPTDGRA